MRKTVEITICLLLAALLWIPSLQLCFPVGLNESGPDSIGELLWHAQLEGWQDPTGDSEGIERMRLANGEWDFMARTFFVLSLANRAIAHPDERGELLRIADQIIEGTITLEEQHGQAHFLLPYGQARPFMDPNGRSVFVDGEIALMLAARQRVRREPRWDGPLRERVERITEQMQRSPLAVAESYPNECWTFCNTVALAALRLSDHVSGDSHEALIQRWLQMAREHLVEPETGLLVSSFTLDGQHLDGPEGSSIFLVAHMLQVVDPEFARDQYARARRELGEAFFGFGWAHEWPESGTPGADIDSGPIVPVLDASAGSSGMALLGAAAFEDQGYLESLHRSLRLAAFPIQTGGGLRFAASNPVGDAVLLYSLTQGPLWSLIVPPSDLVGSRGDES